MRTNIFDTTKTKNPCQRCGWRKSIVNGTRNAYKNVASRTSVFHFSVTIQFITLRQETYGDVYVENKEFIPTLWLYWVYLKSIVVMNQKSLEKCELWVLLLDLELEIWMSVFLNFRFWEIYGDLYYRNKNEMCWIYHFSEYF